MPNLIIIDDVPYVGWDPANKGPHFTLSNGIGANSDASFAGASTWETVRCVLGRPHTDFAYWEIQNAVGSSGDIFFHGMAGSAVDCTVAGTFAGGTSPSCGMRSDNNVTGWTKSQTGLVTGVGTLNNVVGFCLRNGKLYIRVNGVWAFSGDPVAETGYWVSGITGIVYPATSNYPTDAIKPRLRTLASQMTGSIPSGAVAWAGG